MFGAEGDVLDRMIGGVIRQAQLDRIHLQEVGEFIERALQREDAGTFAGRAHESGRGDVDRENRLLHPDRFARVHDAGRTRAARSSTNSPTGEVRVSVTCLIACSFPFEVAASEIVW